MSSMKPKKTMNTSAIKKTIANSFVKKVTKSPIETVPTGHKITSSRKRVYPFPIYVTDNFPDPDGPVIASLILLAVLSAFVKVMVKFSYKMRYKKMKISHLRIPVENRNRPRLSTGI